MQDACPAVGSLRGFQDRVGGRRGEHRTGHGRVQHAFSDEARVQGFVPRSAAGNEADLALGLRNGAGDEIGRVVNIDDVGVGQGESLQGFADDGVNIIDELLHGASLQNAHLFL